MDKKVKDGWSVSRAQAVSALRPGCLPWTLPRRETSALDAHVLRTFECSYSGTVMTNLRCCVWSISAMIGCCAVVGRDQCWVCVIELLAWEAVALLPAR